MSLKRERKATVGNRIYEFVDFEVPEEPEACCCWGYIFDLAQLEFEICCNWADGLHMLQKAAAYGGHSVPVAFS